MQRRWLVPGLLSVLLLFGFAAHESEELDRNRRLLEKWKNDPEHHRRLKRDLADFYALPSQRQEAIRSIDEYIHETDPSTQTRLWGVLERYSDWMENLSPSERRAVLDAPTKDERLGVIRALKQREWIARLPRKVREELDGLPPENRVARLTQLRLDEQRQRVLWQRTGGGDDQIPRPTRLSEMPAEVQAFVKQHLLPRTTKQDEKLLKLAEGKWPEYPKTLAALSERYPVYPEGPLGKITRPEQLPESVRGLVRPDKFAKKGKGFNLGPAVGMMRLQPATGKWPEFALVATELMRNEKVYVPLGASKPSEFPKATQEYLERVMFPWLSMTERQDLEGLEGRWPDYPRRLLLLAKRHRKVIPGMSLPGPPAMWDAARVAKQELSEEERAGIEWLANDLGFGRDKGHPSMLPSHFPKKPRGSMKGGR